MRQQRWRISLSLSLSTPWFLAKKASVGALCGAAHHSLGSICRVSERGVCSSRPESRGLFERRCHFPHLAVTFEEAPLRAPTRDGCSAECRGSDPGPRHCPIACCLTALGGSYCFAPSRVSSYNTRGVVPSFLEETVRLECHCLRAF